jgi:quinol-cytochrome oxidoreductase complex cytochrome b subunit
MNEEINNFLNEDFVLGEIDPPSKYFSLERNELRKDWMYKTTHILALIILIFFLVVLSYQIILRPDKIIVPDYFISIVSVVIGFYFAKSLP